MQPRSLPVGAAGCKSARRQPAGSGGSISASTNVAAVGEGLEVGSEGASTGRIWGVKGRRGADLPRTVTDGGSTPPRTLPCLVLYERITQPCACLHRKRLITISFTFSAACTKGRAVLGALPTRQWRGTLRWLFLSSLLPFFTWGSLAESSACGRKRRLARCVIRACSSSDLG